MRHGPSVDLFCAVIRILDRLYPDRAWECRRKSPSADELELFRAKLGELEAIYEGFPVLKNKKRNGRRS